MKNVVENQEVAQAPGTGYQTGVFNPESSKMMGAPSDFIREDAEFQRDHEMDSRSEMSAQIAQQSAAMSFSR